MGVHRGIRGGQWSSPKSLGKNMFFIIRKNEIISIKEDYRNEKKKENFNYVPGGILMLILSYIDFLIGCLLAMK